MSELDKLIKFLSFGRQIDMTSIVGERMVFDSEQATAELAALRAENAALKAKLEQARDALKPFALESEEYTKTASNAIHPFIKGRLGEVDERARFTIGDLRAASTVLKETE